MSGRLTSSMIGVIVLASVGASCRSESPRPAATSLDQAIQVVVLEYAPSTEIAETINELWNEPQSPPVVQAVADPASNRITLRAPAAELPNVVEFVGRLDQRWGAFHARPK